MALDTAAKRASALGAGFPPGTVLPIPDGTIDAADRAALLGEVIPTAGVGGSWAAVTNIGGWAANELGVMGTNFLADGVPVPGGAFFIAGFAHSSDGRRYVCPWPATGIVHVAGCVARRPDGAMCIAPSGTPGAYRGGWPLSARGEVLASESTPELIFGGIGFLQNGSICLENVD